MPIRGNIAKKTKGTAFLSGQRASIAVEKNLIIFPSDHFLTSPE